MSIRDEKYKLKGCIEFDEVFFERVDNKDIITENKERECQEKAPKKSGRGSERQAKVLVMVD